jgi:hypothetical protein
MRFATVHEDMLRAVPELRDPYRRLFDDWDNFGGESPGQYIVFSDTYGVLVEIAATLPPETTGRDELLRRLLDFGDAMMAASDIAVHDLAIDALAERLDAHPAGREIAQRLGGPKLNAWFSAFSTQDWERAEPDEIIDLWGVRQAVASLLPSIPAHEIPGISYPRAGVDLGSVTAANEHQHGVVMLAAYGTTHLCAVVRARDVAISDQALDALAEELAAIIGRDLPDGKPRAHYLAIPPGERVWNMHGQGERHARLWDEAWVAEDLLPFRDSIIAVLRGKTSALRR